MTRREQTVYARADYTWASIVAGDTERRRLLAFNGAWEPLGEADIAETIACLESAEKRSA